MKSFPDMFWGTWFYQYFISTSLPCRDRFFLFFVIVSFFTFIFLYGLSTIYPVPKYNVKNFGFIGLFLPFIIELWEKWGTLSSTLISHGSFQCLLCLSFSPPTQLRTISISNLSGPGPNNNAWMLLKLTFSCLASLTVLKCSSLRLAWLFLFFVFFWLIYLYLHWMFPSILSDFFFFWQSLCSLVILSHACLNPRLPTKPQSLTSCQVLLPYLAPIQNHVCLTVAFLWLL